MPPNRRYDRALGIPLVVFLSLIWETASRLAWVDPILLPAPTRVLAKLTDLLSQRGLYIDLGVSTYRFLSGYFIGCLITIPLGLAIGISRKLYLSTDILLECLRPIPASALIPVALLLFGLGDATTIAIVTYAVVWPVLINTIDGVRSVDPLLIDTGKVFGLSPTELVRHIYIPASLPGIATGMRIALALSITLVIVVEMLVGDQGLGHRIIDAERTFRFAEMYALTILIGLLGYSANRAFFSISRMFIGWHVEAHEQAT